MARQSAAALAAQEATEKTHELLGKLISLQLENKGTEAREREMIDRVANPLKDVETIDKKKIVIDPRLGYIIIAAFVGAGYMASTAYNGILNDISKLKDNGGKITVIEQSEQSHEKAITLLAAKQDEMLSKISDISDDTKRLNSQVSTALTKITK